MPKKTGLTFTDRLRRVLAHERNNPISSDTENAVALLNFSDGNELPPETPLSCILYRLAVMGMRDCVEGRDRTRQWNISETGEVTPGPDFNPNAFDLNLTIEERMRRLIVWRYELRLEEIERENGPSLAGSIGLLDAMKDCITRDEVACAEWTISKMGKIRWLA